MRYPNFERVEVLLPNETYAALKQLVGGREMSPTVRRLVEEYVAQEPVRRAIEEARRRDE